MLALKDARYLACSSDGIAIIAAKAFGWAREAQGYPNTDYHNDCIIETVEIKTRVSCTSLGEPNLLINSDCTQCKVGDATFRKYIPKCHMARILHQLVIVRTNFAVYVLTTVTRLLYAVAIRCSDTMLQLYASSLVENTERLVKWPHQAELTLPGLVPNALRKTM